MRAPPAGSRTNRNFSPMPLPCPERRRLIPLRIILPEASNFTSLRASATNSGNVDGGVAIPASLNIALL